MSVSALYSAKIAASPCPLAANDGAAAKIAAIECSSRPKKKATAHHMKTRPRKTQPWDVRRRPTVYPPLPSLPPDWTLLSPATVDADASASPSPTSSSSPAESPVTSP